MPTTNVTAATVIGQMSHDRMFPVDATIAVAMNGVQPPNSPFPMWYGNDIDVFAVTAAGAPSATPVVSADPGAVPFAVSFDAGGHLAVAEAGTNSVATFTVGRDGKLTLVSRAATGQMATCWIARDGSLFYASNAGSASVSVYADSGSGALQALVNTAAGAGTAAASALGGGGYGPRRSGSSSSKCRARGPTRLR